MIQETAGPIHMSADDFQATDSGITYGVKFRVIDTVFALVVEKRDGDWIGALTIDSDVAAGIAKAGSPAAYSENIIRPAVKAWLAQRKLQPATPAQEVAAMVGKWQSL